MKWREDKPETVGVYLVTVELTGEEVNRIVCCAEYQGTESARYIEDTFTGAHGYSKEWHIMWPITNRYVRDYGEARTKVEDRARKAYRTARVVAWADDIAPYASPFPDTVYGDVGWADLDFDPWGEGSDCDD